MPTLRVQVVVDDPAGNVTLSKASGAQLEAQDQKVTGAAITVPKDSSPPGVVTLDQGDPGAVAVQKKFAGSMKQFYAGQARVHARGGNAQTRTRTDRGDHQIEYLNQFGQEQVTLRVPESVYNSAKAEDFIPLDLLVGYIEGSVIPGSGASSAAYNVSFYSRELYNPSTAPTTPAVSETVLPPGVAYVYPYTPFAPKVFRTERDGGAWFWLDLRGFPRDAVVGVDVYIYHNTDGAAEEVITGSELAAVVWSAWDSLTGGTTQHLTRFTSPTYSRSSINSEFPEYSALSDATMSRIAGFPDRMKIKGGGSQGLVHWSSSDTVSNPLFDAMQALSPVGSFVIAGDILLGLNYVESGPTTYHPDTSYVRTVMGSGMVNTELNDKTKPSATPGDTGWVLDSDQEQGFNPLPPPYYNTSFALFENTFLFMLTTDIVVSKVPLQFEVRGLGVIGAAVPDDYDYDDPFSRPQTAQLAEELPVAPNEKDPISPTVANHFEGTLLGTMFVDRKSHAVMWSTAD